MKITIVNGTNRIGNRSIEISRVIGQIAHDMGFTINLITLDSFDTLFRGDYIRLVNATLSQKQDIRSLITADIIIFVIPTYHAGIPSSFKNFLDILKCNECYDNKIIGIISSNNQNRDLGARQGFQTINGILAYSKLHSFIVPIIPVINFDDVDKDRIKHFISYCSIFADKDPVLTRTILKRIL